MALRDLLAPRKQAPTQPKGASGRAHTHGYIAEDELNAKLIGQAGLRVYDEMWRTDGDVRRTLLMAIAPLVAGTWEMDPYGDDEDGPDPTTDEDREVAELVEWCLWEAMDPALDAHLWEALAVAGRYGRAPFETVYRVARWRDRDIIALDCLDLRLPRTVQRYRQDGPRLTGIEQFVINKGLVPIPATDLLFYRFGAEGDNWEGQALAPDTPMPTPDGWQTMADLRPGSKVYDETGAIRYVTARKDWTDRPCYEVRFTSGDTIIADANHLWLSHTHKTRNRGGEAELLTTEQMAASVKYATRLNNHAVPLAGALDNPPQHLLVDPYVLGYWLGDGNKNSAAITTADQDVLDEFAARGYEPTKAHGQYHYRVNGNMQVHLRALGVLNDKHAPEHYLRGSRDQRLELLRGLMDSDGNVGGKNASRAEFSNTNERLADAAVDLVFGLGGRATKQFVNKAGVRNIMGRDCNVKDLWRVHFTLPQIPFRTRRKAERWEADTTKSRQHHFIESITPVAPRDMICIEVDSPSHLYLAGRTLVATHNSLLRPAYKHHKMKAGLELMQARALERAGLGVPTGYPPEGASDPQRDAFETFLQEAAEGKQPYYLAPGPAAQFAEKGQGWHWEYVSPLNAHQAAEAFQTGINHHRDSIAAVLLEEFMRQGQGKVGTNATAKTQQNPFVVLLQAIAGTVILSPINRHLIPRLVGLNYQTDRFPKLRCSLIDEATLTDLATYVKTLYDAGAIRPEPTLEKFLRQKGNLPPADEQAILDAEKKKADEAAAQVQQAHDQAVAVAQARGTPPPGTPPAASSKQMSLDDDLKALARQDRELRPWEQVMSLDRIEATIDGARARFEQACGPLARQLAITLAAQAQAGRAITPKAGPMELRDAVATELQGLYDVGRQTVREELHRQAMGVDVPHLLGAASLPGWLRDRARAAADAVRAAIGLALGRSRVRRDQSHAQLQQVAEQAALGALRQEAQHHAAAALNAGRTDQADEMAALIAGSRYTSILDGSRCAACKSADDDVLRPLDDPVRLAHVPPNPACHGGDRCRCLEAFQMRAEAAPAI